MIESKIIAKKDYILKAAKLYGLGNVEIEALRGHLDGTAPNDFIQRRCEFLFRLYDIYCQEPDREKIKMNSDGVINLNDFSFEISKRRLDSSKIGRCWILCSNLDSFLVTTPADKSKSIKSKFIMISEKNNFLLPQIAKSMDLDAVVYYKGEYTDENGTFSTHHLTKNFLNDEETLIEGNSIIKDNPKKKRIKFESLLESTEKYVKKHYKKYKSTEDELLKARTDIRRGLIKQTFFNKFVFNENESNKKWGLIKDKNNRLRLAPLFSYDFSCGAEPIEKGHHRCINGNKEDIQTFMLKYGKETWFREWIKDFVLPFDLGSTIQAMHSQTGVVLTDEEYEYYSFLFGQMKEKVQEVVDLNYDENEIRKRKNIRTRLKEFANSSVQRAKRQFSSYDENDSR